MQAIQFIEKIYSKDDSRSKPEISFCLTTSSDNTKLKVSLGTLNVQIVSCTLLPLEIDDIRAYMMKAIQFHNVTDKKAIVEECLGVDNTTFTESHPKRMYVSLLRNPLYLHIYCSYLSQKESIADTSTCLLNTFNRYSLLK